MPIPKPNKNENQSDFLKRCTPALYPEYNDQRQAVAICINTYEKANMNLSTAERVAMKMRGISLLADLEDACWEGYVAIGMKDDGGRMVPNCVPIKDEMEKIMAEKGINLADEGGGSYPWDECIADQEARYGDEETAKKVCGYIKSEYGS